MLLDMRYQNRHVDTHGDEFIEHDVRYVIVRVFTYSQRSLSRS